jgi:hypothetical protein
MINLLYCYAKYANDLVTIYTQGYWKSTLGHRLYTFTIQNHISKCPKILKKYQNVHPDILCLRTKFHRKKLFFVASVKKNPALQNSF